MSERPMQEQEQSKNYASIKGPAGFNECKATQTFSPRVNQIYFHINVFCLITSHRYWV